MSESLIVGFDGSEGSTDALRWAAKTAKERDWMLYVLTTWTMPAADLGIGASATLQEELIDELRKEAGAVNDEGVQIAADMGVNAVGEIAVGRSAAILVKRSADSGMVVVGSHGRGRLAESILGSVSQSLIHHAECPVLVVR